MINCDNCGTRLCDSEECPWAETKECERVNKGSACRSLSIENGKKQFIESINLCPECTRKLSGSKFGDLPKHLRDKILVEAL